MTTYALPIPSASGSLDSYIQTVNRFPILSQPAMFLIQQQKPEENENG